MAEMNRNKFAFSSGAPGLDKNTFEVVSFKGFEAISQPYKFDILLVSRNDQIDFLEVLKNSAEFTISRGHGQQVVRKGILSEFEEVREHKRHFFFRAVLSPKLWWLMLSRYNRVFIDKSVDEIIKSVLEDCGLVMGEDFDFQFRNTYPKMDYTCQYNETNYNFISRWAEWVGIYYYFDQANQYSKVLFTDHIDVHTDLAHGADLNYSPVSGLEFQKETQVVRSLLSKNQVLPQKVYLKNYDYLHPSLSVEGSAVVDQDGHGEDYIYGEHFVTPQEGDQLAQIRAEELKSKQTLFIGESSIDHLAPGYTYKLKDHYKDTYNQKYLLTEMSSEGHQAGFFENVVRAVWPELAGMKSYENTFTAISANVQFRAERRASKPRVSGSIHAVVDAEGSGDYAEIDEYGRYKIKLPFDLAEYSKGGAASAYLRLMEPYGGPAEGMHFPLRKGTEVILSFINGDPDRPVIAGVVPNPLTSSPVREKNKTESVIRTPADNKLLLMDENKGERIVMESPKTDTWVRLGVPNRGDQASETVSKEDQKYVRDQDPADGFRLHTGQDLAEDVKGDRHQWVQGKKREQIGVSAVEDQYDFAASDPKKGSFIDGKLETVISGNHIEQVGVKKSADAHDFSPEPNKGVYVKGDNEMYVGGNCTIKKKVGEQEIKIEMTETGITIDAGDQDLQIFCKNRGEIIKGNDNWFAHGNKDSGRAGSTRDIFLGNKASICVAAQESLSLAEKLSFSFGPQQTFGYADDISILLGIYKLAIDLRAINFTYFGGLRFTYDAFKVKSNDLLISKGIGAIKKGLKLTPAVIEIGE